MAILLFVKCIGAGILSESGVRVFILQGGHSKHRLVRMVAYVSFILFSNFIYFVFNGSVMAFLPVTHKNKSNTLPPAGPFQAVLSAKPFI